MDHKKQRYEASVQYARSERMCEYRKRVKQPAGRDKCLNCRRVHKRDDNIHTLQKTGLWPKKEEEVEDVNYLYFGTI
jgi:hypothetical protein